jgi:hypothetical protein
MNADEGFTEEQIEAIAKVADERIRRAENEVPVRNPLWFKAGTIGFLLTVAVLLVPVFVSVDIEDGFGRALLLLRCWALGAAILLAVGTILASLARDPDSTLGILGKTLTANGAMLTVPSAGALLFL